MAEKVPAFIRRRALKLLWRSDPAFALIDGLDDYDEDFSLAKLVGKLISDSKNVSKRHEAGADDDRMVEEEESVGADGDDQGFIKVLTAPRKDRVLGATIMSCEAGNLITEYVSAMKHGIGLNKILGTIHIYPTMAEANKFVAGTWKKNNAPKKLLKLVQKFHAWRLR